MAGSDRAAKPSALRAESRHIWDQVATFWDGRGGAGIAFHTMLVEPAFPPSADPRRPGSTTWENDLDIPHVLAVRLALPPSPAYNGATSTSP